MRLGVFVQTAGHHVARLAPSRKPSPTGWPDLPLMKHIAATAERGKFDMFFLADGFTTGYDDHPSMIGKFEPLTLLSALAMATTQARPRRDRLHHLRRALPHRPRLRLARPSVSGGRAGWNVVTTPIRSPARCSAASIPPHAERYAHRRGIRRGVPAAVG